MAESKAMSVRGMEPDLYRWLKIRAAKHDRSMEAEAREIFAEARREEESQEEPLLGTFLHSLAMKYGGFDDLEIPPRENSPATWADFSE